MADESTGRVAVVTGATGGIGKEIARGLARAGYTLVIGARSREKGEAVRDELAKEPGAGAVHAMIVDVASQASIRAFASEVTSRFPAVQLLVNNAGAWFTDPRKSPDGIELTWATNVLGPHLLTGLLADALKRGAPARVINVVSGLASDYDPTDVQFEKRKYDGFKVYAQSKQALRMLTWGWAKKLEKDRVVVHAVAPGLVRTEFNANAKGVLPMVIGVMARFFGRTPAKGAETPLWVATAAEHGTTTGKFFDDHREKDGKFREPAAIAELESICDRMTAPSAGEAALTT